MKSSEDDRLFPEAASQAEWFRAVECREELFRVVGFRSAAALG